jgi:transcriptional regulator with PAS, ATPase and Fis domain
MLDEIGDLRPDSQLKLLRFLQDGEYMPLGRDAPKQTQVRVVAVTNEDLLALQKKGRFRKDLFFRLQTHQIHIPPLRERPDDIPILVDHFLEASALALNVKKPRVPRELFTLMATYSYPGNVRELEAMIFDAVSRHRSGVLSLKVFKSHLAKKLGGGSAVTETSAGVANEIVFPRELPTIKQTTKLLVAEAMSRAKGNQSIAASMLGISQQALSKRLIQEKANAQTTSS